MLVGIIGLVVGSGTGMCKTNNLKVSDPNLGAKKNTDPTEQGFVSSLSYAVKSKYATNHSK